MKQLSDAGVCAVRVGNGVPFDDVAAGKYQFGMRGYVDLSSVNVLFILIGLYSFCVSRDCHQFSLARPICIKGFQ